MILENLLESLKRFIEEDLKDYKIPVKQDGWQNQPLERPAEVSLMIMPDPDEEHERIPYILLQLLNGRDKRINGIMQSSANIRIVIEIYNRDKKEGRLQIVHIIETLRRDFFHAGIIGGSFELLELEYLIYPDDTEWYHAGELSTEWSVPPEERDTSAAFNTLEW